MDRRRLLMAGGFPKEPSAYDELIGKYSTSQTWFAPENGWFLIEVHGASGNGGKNYDDNMPWIDYEIYFHSGGGGGGGGYAASKVMLKKGDAVEIVCGNVGAKTSAVIDSSKEEYNVLSVKSGANGEDAQNKGSFDTGYGLGGAGGVATGGNYANNNGSPGGNGNTFLAGDFGEGYEVSGSRAGGVGGAPGHVDGNPGGKGQDGDYNTSIGYGKAGFIKIFRGNTN